MGKDRVVSLCIPWYARPGKPTNLLAHGLLAVLLSICAQTVVAESAPGEGESLERLEALAVMGELRMEAMGLLPLPGYRTYRGEWTFDLIRREQHRREAWRREARAVPMAAEDQTFVIGTILDSLSYESPPWNVIRTALHAAEFGGLQDHAMADALRSVLTYPRGEKISRDHAASLKSTLAVAGFSSTDTAYGLLLEATADEFWHSVGPVRTDLPELSELPNNSVTILRRRAVEAIGNGDTQAALAALRSAGTENIDPGLSRLVNQVIADLEERIEVPLDLREDAPARGSGRDWEQLAAITSSNDERINVFADGMRARILRGEINADDLPVLRRDLARVRAHPADPSTLTTIRDTLRRAAHGPGMDWPVIREGILALYHLHTNDPDIFEILKEIVRTPRTAPVSDAQSDALEYGIRVIGKVGTEAAVELLTDMSTRAFWERTGPVEFSTFQRELRTGDAIELMRLEAVSALGSADPDYALPVLDAYARQYRQYRNTASPSEDVAFEYLVLPRIDRARQNLNRRLDER